MPKSQIRRLIQQGSLALKAVMIEHLSIMAENMIQQVIAHMKTLPESKRMDAIMDLQPKGVQAYREAMLAAMSVISADALKEARKEVPNGKSVQLSEDVENSLQLGEFEKLPASIRNKLFRQYQLLSMTQITDLQKTIAWQFNHSVDSTDSLAILKADLEDAAYEMATGPRVTAGAGSIASQIVNETRGEFFDDPEIRSQISAFRFVNGDPVSPICQDLAGTIFDVDDPDRFRYTPPLHFNCKSYIEPIIELKSGMEITKLKPSTAKLEDSIQFSEQVCCGHVHIDGENPHL